jgi:mono/diheme cytochrome c family protein
MMSRLPRASALLSLLLMVGCGGHDFEPPDRGERVREAEAAFSPAVFDSVSWASDSLRAFSGNTVYAEKCGRCHGPLGRGNTDYARGRGLEVPSLVEPESALTSVDTLRHVIFVGHEEGMPIFGAGGITPREIDGVAYYILNVLRPDAVETSGF